MLRAPRRPMQLVTAEGGQAKAARHVGRAPEQAHAADREQRGSHAQDLEGFEVVLAAADAPRYVASPSEKRNRHECYLVAVRSQGICYVLQR